MRKTIIITAVLLYSLTGKAQESSAKLKVHAANMGLGSFHLEKDVNGHDGVCFVADLTLSLNKNLISASYLGGTSIKILDGPNYNFEEFSLLYGREWKALNWLRFEGFAGLGQFKQSSKDSNIGEDSTVSFPLRINTKFYFTKKFGMGFNTNYSINSINNNFSNNIIFHLRFN
ncbi:hypothetical protein [Flavobacterium wongokense]|uniref:hypothetical protein n=1 Tax=Flavobacterium wongokense TaxID=2910674 RepID=UPI001F2CFAFE|nr:hypothetical protein [Flavobacterium sp. WG47]MCF6132520.1 hypothetical protein [Flavobacterium sp. WG47]